MCTTRPIWWMALSRRRVSASADLVRMDRASQVAVEAVVEEVEEAVEVEAEMVKAVPTLPPRSTQSWRPCCGGARSSSHSPSC